MSINKNALSSSFRPISQSAKSAKAEFRKQQAVFYTLRSMIWEQSKGSVFRDALADGTIVAIAPGKRLKDGSYSKAEFDQDDISELYSNAQARYNDQFDQAFIKATTEEMVQYSEEYFGKGLDYLLNLNAERSALRFARG